MHSMKTQNIANWYPDGVLSTNGLPKEHQLQMFFLFCIDFLFIRIQISKYFALHFCDGIPSQFSCGRYRYGFGISYTSIILKSHQKSRTICFQMQTNECQNLSQYFKIQVLLGNCLLVCADWHIINTKLFLFKLWNRWPMQDICQNHYLCSRICEKHNGVTEVKHVHSCVKYMISVSKLAFFTILQCVIESNYHVTVWVTHNGYSAYSIWIRLKFRQAINNVLVNRKYFDWNEIFTRIVHDIQYANNICIS